MTVTSITPVYRLGVDVGGTNTDCVLLNSQVSLPDAGIIATHKAPTTAPIVTAGIKQAVKHVLDQSGVPGHQVSCLNIGTTQFLNAVIERDPRKLSKVAVIRLSRSFTRDIPPFSDFPVELTRLIRGYYGYVDGGLHMDGSEEAQVVEHQVRARCAEIMKHDASINAIVIVGVFSPIDTQFLQEERVRDIISQELPGVDIVCSSDVSQLGLLERENAAILNASILKFARQTIADFERAMTGLDITCPLFMTQNDGTLISASEAKLLPIRTFSSGPTNSMRGAAYLGFHEPNQAGGHENGVKTSSITTGADQGKSTLGTGEKVAAIVMDIGGTTTDVGVLLQSGFPRQAATYVSVAGVRVNFGMPHIESIGLGGGSLVKVQPDGQVTLDPKSVGYQLSRKAIIFGGDVLTATDIAVAAGTHNDTSLGEPSRVNAHLGDRSHKTITKSQAAIKAMLEDVIDLIKTSPDPVPVMLVGGGSIIAPDDLKGASKVFRPPYFSVANAVGAAIAKVGGSANVIRDVTKQPLEKIVEEAEQAAIKQAVNSGAQEASVEIADVEIHPVQYSDNHMRVVVRAVGVLAPESRPVVGTTKESAEGGAAAELRQESQYIEPEGGQLDNVEIDARDGKAPADGSTEVNLTSSLLESERSVDNYRPTVTQNSGTGVWEWIISEVDIEWLAEGCYVLGCGGGGSPRGEFLKIRDQIRQGYVMRIIDVESLKDEAVVYWGGNMGSPVVSVERLASHQTEEAVDVLMKYLGDDSVDAFMALEIGGGNGLQGLALGSTKWYGRPTVDGDFMGRAYPTYWQTTPCIYEKNSLVPCAVDSGDGSSIVMVSSRDAKMVDSALRATCSEMGSSVGIAAKPISKEQILQCGVRNTLSQAWRIGRCIARGSTGAGSVMEQIVQECGGEGASRVLFSGKIVSVLHQLIKGHSYGELTIRAIQQSDQTLANEQATEGSVKIPFKNENIYAQHVGADGTTSYLAMVPDLIAVLDSRTGRALGVPEYRYGAIVTVIGIACSPHWTETAKGLELGGLAAFGFPGVEYVPLGTYVKPRSVVKEFQRQSHD